jgi:hypothetical protein
LTVLEETNRLDSVVGIAVRLWAGSGEFYFHCNFRINFGLGPAFYLTFIGNFNVYWKLFYGDQSGRGVKMTKILRPLQELRMILSAAPLSLIFLA